MTSSLTFLFKRQFIQKIALFSFILLVLPLPKLFAIHAILKDGEALPRTVESITLEMPIESFLQKNEGELEVPAAIGQFEDERRFQLDSFPSRRGIDNLIVDFFQGILFRIEVNYLPLDKDASTVEHLIETWSRRFGPPRINVLPETRLLFWDDGATRLILAIEDAPKAQLYSVTYIDDDLFHRISRERVQRETSGQSSYGK